MGKFIYVGIDGLCLGLKTANNIKNLVLIVKNILHFIDVKISYDPSQSMRTFYFANNQKSSENNIQSLWPVPARAPNCKFNSYR